MPPPPDLPFPRLRIGPSLIDLNPRAGAMPMIDGVRVQWLAVGVAVEPMRDAAAAVRPR